MIRILARSISFDNDKRVTKQRAEVQRTSPDSISVYDDTIARKLITHYDDPANIYLVERLVALFLRERACLSAPFGRRSNAEVSTIL